MLPKYHTKMGHDVTVIASLVSFNKEGRPCLLETPTQHIENGYRVIRLAYKKPTKINRTLRRYEKFYETLSAESPDIIFTHGIAMADVTILIKYLKKQPHVRLYGDNHADYINSARNFMSLHVLHKIIWRHYARKLQPYLTKCYGVTPMRCRFLKEMYKINPKIVEFLPMGVDDEAIPQDRETIKARVRNELDIMRDDFVIITGGKIDRLKNTHILIDALKTIDNPQIHLIICGVLAPEMKYLEAEFNENIHYLGWCNAPRLMDCMVAADIACFPGTHSTLWEQAVGVGLPAVLKHWREMTHMDINGNCIFIQGEDVEELSLVLTRLFNPKKYSEIKEKASAAAQSFLYSKISMKAIEQYL